MQDNDTNVLMASDEEICAFFIEDASRLRRIVELMPAGDLSANFLNALWAYAVKHDRLADLANVILTRITRLLRGMRTAIGTGSLSYPLGRYRPTISSMN